MNILFYIEIVKNRKILFFFFLMIDLTIMYLSIIDIFIRFLILKFLSY